MDLEHLIPLGSPDYEWIDADWNEYEAVLDLCDEKAESRQQAEDWKDLVWDWVWDHRYGAPEQYSQYGSEAAVPSSTSVHDMTDDEWKAFEQDVYGYDTYGGSATLLSEQDQKAKDRVVDPRCTDICKGPSHPTTPQYTTHVSSCPCYDPKVDGSAFTYDVHRHKMFPVQLMDGITVYASSARSRWKKADKEDEKPDSDVEPTLGIYLDDTWTDSAILVTPGLEVPLSAPSIPHALIDWPDYNLPNVNDEGMVAMLRWVLDKAETEAVEIGCVGGHGRTGTMLACLLTVQGVLPATAVLRVREQYCAKAVESVKQVVFVADIHELVHGEEWQHNKPEIESYLKLTKQDNKPKGGGAKSQQSVKQYKNGQWYHSIY